MTEPEFETPESDVEAIFTRLECLSLLVEASALELSWHRAPDEEKAAIAARFHSELSRALATPRLTFSPNERALLSKPLPKWTIDDRINIGWRMEAISVLAWSIDLIDEVPPFDTAFGDFELAARLAKPERDAALHAKAKLRSPAELDAVQATAERWHWCAVQADTFFETLQAPTHTLKERRRAALEKVLGGKVTLFGKPYDRLNFEEASRAHSTAIERHTAINWVWDAEPWDDVTIDT